MISGTGIDIIEIERVKSAIEKNEKFKHLVFSEEEIQYCEGEGTAFESFAGRFAAKEAFFKALGTGWRDKMAFYEIIVLNDNYGKPYIKLTGATKEVVEKQTNSKVHVSISHSKHYATAMVIIEICE